MFILLTIGLIILKFLALGVIALFFAEDLELTKSVSGVIYSIYFTLGVSTFFSLLFFILGRRFLWLSLCMVCGFAYFVMYNSAPEIKEIHKQNNLKSRYFKDTDTFLARMSDVWVIINKDKR